MILYPAIDLKEGQCVRLLRGDMDAATVYNDDPGAQATAFRDQGFAWIHVVDLDGAMAGYPVNGAAVSAILEAAELPVQLGGGIRDMATLEAWLDLGVGRVVLGTAALRDPGLANEACSRFPGQVAIGIDARGGHVATDGWVETSEVTMLDLARRFEDAGAAAIVYTDIERDGALTGANVEATATLARAIATPVIASGGVASLDDIAALQAEAGAGIEGVILGRALYDGRVDPAAALALVNA
jgi:phosphoribosylformimino-5-aminoimidazole carboxamide ribotide isomerase